MKRLYSCLIIGLTLTTRLWGAELPWGDMKTEGPYRVLTIKDWPASRMLPLTSPFPNIVSARLESGNRSIHWMFNEDASRIALGLPMIASGVKPPRLRLLTTEKTIEYPDGTIVLSALDARVVGDRAKLETHPGNHRIGFWTNPRDHVDWAFASKAGAEYEVEIAFSRSGPPGAKIVLEIDDQRLPFTLATTGNWYVYTGQDVGRISIPKVGRHVARVRCEDPAGGAVMNLKAVVLRPGR
jgi:hypothetical protein